MNFFEASKSNRLLNMIKTISSALTVVTLAGLLQGCVSPDGRPDYTGSGALIGGASGAAIGAMADRRAPGAGALIGGAAGLIAGGLIGHSMDQDAQRERMAEAPVVVAPPPGSPPPTIADIKSMSKVGVSDDVIINQINSSHAIYNLDANAIIDLNGSGVSQRVISVMIGTANSSVATAPPTPQTEVVVASPGPDYVWVGGEWVWRGGGWVWIGGHWSMPPHLHAVWIGPHWVRYGHGWRREPGYWRY